MKLKQIDKKNYLDFALNNKYISIYQLPEWGDLKAINGWKSHLLGLYENDNLKGVTLLLEKRLPLNLSLFYAPRGFLFDVSNYDILKEFTKEIKKYLKKYHAVLLKVDPNVTYATYDENKENQNITGDKILTNFISLGYHHYGFTQNFETMQPRFLCRFPLQNTYEETLNTFAKSTKKNIEKTEKMGVRTRKINVDEIDLFVSLLKETGDLKNFIIRPASYYKKMAELMPEYVYLYVTYIDTKLYLDYVNEEIKNVKNEQKELEEKMAKDHVGKKLLTSKNELENKLEKLKKDLVLAKDLVKKGTQINIGALMSIFMADEGITFMSGTVNSYKKFNPKYAYYNEHIKECLKQKKKYCNFYGISGDLNPKNPYYSIYEIKKGFKPEIIELLGEFDLILNPLGHCYKLALKLYKTFKRK